MKATSCDQLNEKEIVSKGQNPESQADRQSDGQGGWC